MGNVRFNDGSCGYYSTEYLCQPIMKKKPVPTKCRSGSPSNCKVSNLNVKGYSPGGLVRIHNGRRVRKSTETDSCPNGWKVWSPRNKNDWTLVYNKMGKNINNYPKKPHFIVDVTRPANGCGGCTKYAMKSGVGQQGSWRTKDGSAWWLRDSKYNEPNGDYHANCYLHVYDVNPNNVRFNDGSCGYSTTDYLCQMASKKGPSKGCSSGTGKNSCAQVNKKPITTEAGCKAAAKAMKKTYAGKGSYSTWQKACFMTSNRFYFNVHKAGKTHKSGNPVCAGAANTKPKYTMAGNGKSNCGKQKPVSSEAACKAAGKILKKAWGGSGSYAAWPKACFLYNNKLYWNKHAKGKANKSGNPACT